VIIPRARLAAVGLVTAWLLVACREGHQIGWDQPPPGTVMIWADSATAARTATVEPGVLATVRAAPVKGWIGPGQQPFEVALRSAAPEAGHARSFGTVTLPIALRNRVAAIGQYPCTSCHQGRTLVLANRRIRDAHGNIRPVHPVGDGQARRPGDEATRRQGEVRVGGAVCATCHSADDVEQLALSGGERASLDESYRLCAQCHFAQAEAWAGGGHGKRLDGWQGRRVVMPCTDCHDPHRPGIEPRIPFRAPQLERNRSLGP
jgi:hypothetical protein